jgi:hypothetical protein
VSVLRRPLTWAIAVTVLGLASSPVAHYGWEAAAFGIGGAAVVAMELLHRPHWRSFLVWAWMLDATLLTLIGLMFRISSPTAPSGPMALLLCTIVGCLGGWAERGSTESHEAPERGSPAVE